MKFKVTSIRLQYNESGKAEIVLTTDTNKLDISKLKEVIAKGKELVAEIKQYRQKRSLDANSYCWVLMSKLAEVLNTTKEEVYREAVRKVGQYEFLAVRESAVDTFVQAWNEKGLGWYAEEMPECKVPGCKKVMAYYGSSVYDTKAMSILIDYIVNECHEQGIETLTPAEIAGLKEAWSHPH